MTNEFHTDTSSMSVDIFGRCSMQGTEVTYKAQHSKVMVQFEPQANGRWRVFIDPFQDKQSDPPRVIPDDLLVVHSVETPNKSRPKAGSVLRVLRVAGVEDDNEVHQATYIGTRWIDVVVETLDAKFSYTDKTIVIGALS
jgi:hypothetical protein